ncbi:MAG TPA: FAD-dependent oxidoreductase, partial [Candidatus Saccharimonadales bacterium]|nr:FAD-dependent oxidoreductase [Candidatus Saccharimonadales bacterium]
ASHVTLMHRRDTFRASQIMVDRVKKNPKISLLLNAQITEVIGQGKVEKVKVKNTTTEEVSEMPIDGIFVAIGHTPNTAVFKGVEVTDRGYIKAQDGTHTNIEGIFVSGDVEDDRYRQAITAAGFGAQAALDIERYLAEKK